MLLLPADSVALLSAFAPLFSRPVWRHVQVLLVGALLAPGRRMVSTVLRAVGLSHRPTFQASHRVLYRAIWSSLGASRILLRLLVATFAATGSLIIGIDETTPRRRGAKIAAAGIYRDPVRSRPAATSSRSVACAGSVPPSWYPSRGPLGSGPCRSSRCSLRRSVLRSGGGSSSR